MKPMNQLLAQAQQTVRKYTPQILLGMGVAGMIATTVLAVKATPKALTLIETSRAEKQETLSKPEIVKAAWKCYIPAAVTCVASVACIIGGSAEQTRRGAVIGAAYQLSEAAFREYSDKVVEVIGEKKEQEVRDAIAKERIERNPVSQNEVIITQKGDQLCYDSISGRYFKSDIEKLRRAENIVNHQLITQMYVSLNDLYYEFGIDGIEVGYALGWNINTGCINLCFSSQLTPEGTPCVVVEYREKPVYNFDYL